MAVARGGDEQYGGYDYNFMDHEVVRDHYTCDICFKALRDPRLTTCCGQHFCESCLERNRRDSCPYCRVKKDKFRHVLDKKVDREIKSLRVQCTNNEKGCNWVGQLRSLHDHLKLAQGCKYVSIECPFKKVGCQANLTRQLLDAHNQENQQRHLLLLMEDYEKVKNEHEKLKGDLERMNEMKQALSVDVKILNTSKHKKQKDFAMASIQSHLGPSTSTNKLEKTGEIMFRMPNFLHYVLSQKVWNSPSFFVYIGSYLRKLSLAVSANGFGSGKNSHVSFSLLLMKGNYDEFIPEDNESNVSDEDILCRCDAQLQIYIYDQASEDRKYDMLVLPCKCEGVTKVENNDEHKVLKTSEKFVPHESIDNSGYILEDSLLFVIKLEDSECDCECHELDSESSESSGSSTSSGSSI